MPIKELPVVGRGSFFDDSFFKDSWDDFDNAMKRVLDRFDNGGVKEQSKSRPQCQDVYRQIRQDKIGDDMYASQAIQVTEKDGRFQVVMDVKDFNPRDLQVRVVDERIVLEGRFDQVSEDGKSSTSKAFYKEFTLPAQADIDQVSTALSKDGVLTIRAPKKEDYQHPQAAIEKNTNNASQTIQNALNDRMFSDPQFGTNDGYDSLPRELKERLKFSDRDSGRSTASGSPNFTGASNTPSCLSPTPSDIGSDASRTSNSFQKTEVSFQVRPPDYSSPAAPPQSGRSAFSPVGTFSPPRAPSTGGTFSPPPQGPFSPPPQGHFSPPSQGPFSPPPPPQGHFSPPSQGPFSPPPPSQGPFSPPAQGTYSPSQSGTFSPPPPSTGPFSPPPPSSGPFSPPPSSRAPYPPQPGPFSPTPSGTFSPPPPSTPLQQTNQMPQHQPPYLNNESRGGIQNQSMVPGQNRLATRPGGVPAVGSGGTATISVKEEDGKRTMTQETSSLVQEKDGFLESKEIAAEVTGKDNQAARREAVTRMMRQEDDPSGKFSKSEAADASDISESSVQQLPDGSVVTVKKSSTSSSNLKKSFSSTPGAPPLMGMPEPSMSMGFRAFPNMMGGMNPLMSQMSSESIGSNSSRMSNFSDMSNFSRFSDAPTFPSMPSFSDRSNFSDMSNFSRFGNLSGRPGFQNQNFPFTQPMNPSHPGSSQNFTNSSSTSSHQQSFSNTFEDKKF